MKFFAIIGIVMTACWVWHFAGNKVIKPAASSAWNVSAPYLNQAVNKVTN